MPPPPGGAQVATLTNQNVHELPPRPPPQRVGRAISGQGLPINSLLFTVEPMRGFSDINRSLVDMFRLFPGIVNPLLKDPMLKE